MEGPPPPEKPGKQGDESAPCRQRNKNLYGVSMFKNPEPAGKSVVVPRAKDEEYEEENYRQKRRNENMINASPHSSEII